MVIDKHEHALRRRKMAPAFSERALKEAERLISVSAEKLATQITQQPPQDASKPTTTTSWTHHPPQNMGDWATYFGFDFISDLGYGRSFNMLESGENRWIPPVLRSASRFIYYVGYLPFIGLVRPLMGTRIQDYIGGQSAADSLRYTNLANARLAERIALDDERVKREGQGQEGKELDLPSSSSSRRDTFHYLINSRDPVTGKGLTTEALQADSALVIAAGADGVGVTLAALFFYLVRQPAVLARLTREVRAAFASPSDIQTPTLNSLAYLAACIDETMRLVPPKPSTVPREVCPGGVEIDGRWFPAGVTVGTPVYVLHHDKEIYPEPWAFRPERWIVTVEDDDGDDEKGVKKGAAVVDAESVVRARAALCPFLLGPMNCIGKNMAYFALKCSVAHLLWRYDFRLAEGEGMGGVGAGREDLEEGRQRLDEYQIVDFILGFRDGRLWS